MDKPEQTEEIKELIEKAEAGDATAQFILAQKYKKGLNVEQNITKAIEWYKKAAEQGHIQSQNSLGTIYVRGQGIEKDYKTAFYWFTKAAEQGDDIAQYSLGNMYLDGYATKQSDIKAVSWYRKSARQKNADAQCNLGWMYDNGRGVKKSLQKAVDLYIEAASNGSAIAQFNLGLCYMKGVIVEQDNIKAIDLFREAATNSDNIDIRVEAIEIQDEIERSMLSKPITSIRTQILKLLKANSTTTPTMTHYTSLKVGSSLLFEKSPLRLGHISSLNDPNEGKLLWRFLGHIPVENKPVFVGCFLPDEDSLNMWRFYSKNQKNDDACGCAITFNMHDFFNFSLLHENLTKMQKNGPRLGFSNTGKSPQESAEFYRIIYVNEDMNILGDDPGNTLRNLFSNLKMEVNNFLGKSPSNNKFQQLSNLLGPLPYLLKDADYESEKEHRIIVTHLEYGSSEIQVIEPEIENGIPQTSPKLYLELHRSNHLDPIKHVTLGPKAPHREMMAPYWHHKLASEYAEQLKLKSDFYVKASKCAYK
ncbi:tetratricopeptide repeat protein [Aeromonas hydrophila]|uniref:tetratricopeptide repeat protein n=1 Tax=Aeromonas hydrophila TaxID=644 RepID=UPI0019316872|nr:tetratricopeptide repeat protein [Aeromonas hydrophila]MBM0509744.1 DUF2971 domain-containing protein [Aeromonas hydrophila]MBW3771637.1 DUF2971 domain-containing protein [Aeromonas hydrophila]